MICDSNHWIALNYDIGLDSSAYRNACEILKQTNYSKPESHGFETLWDLTTRRVMWYENSPLWHIYVYDYELNLCHVLLCIKFSQTLCNGCFVPIVFVLEFVYLYVCIVEHLIIIINIIEYKTTPAVVYIYTDTWRHRNICCYSVTPVQV